jgi:hypothetical protein
MRPCSSIILIATGRGFACCIQSQNLALPAITPRFTVTSLDLFMPRIFARCSAVGGSRPDTSRNASSGPSPTQTRNECCGHIRHNCSDHGGARHPEGSQ